MRLILLICVTALFWNSCMAIDSNCSSADCINNGIVDVPSAILCKNCLTKIISDKDTALLFYKIQQKIRNGNIRKDLTDLNEDVLMIIFDQLDIIDMMNLCNVYSAEIISSVAERNFWSRFKDFTVNIKKMWKSDCNDLDVKSNYIDFGSTKGTEALRVFRNVIQHLEVEYPSTIVSQYINKYARNSLIQLKIVSAKKDTFDHFTRPFSKVEYLSIDFDSFQNTISDHLSFVEMFPKLQSLELGSNVKLNLVVDAFPSLKHLHVKRIHQKEEFEKILSKNPQIRSIQTYELSTNVCNMINRCLPNLESLTISSTSNDFKNKTSFENVKYVKVLDQFGLEKLKHITFPRLKFLTIKYLTYINSWFDFFKQHKNISHFTVYDIEGNEIHSFIKLLKEMPNLIEITVQYRNYGQQVYFETVASCEKLEKINLLSLPIEIANTLSERLANDWIITAVPSANVGRLNLYLKRKK